LGVTQWKEAAVLHVEDVREEARKIAVKLLENPETAYQEEVSAKILKDFLKEKGFLIEENLSGLATAFRASFERSSGRHVAFVAEYDALVGIGHGCGHNLIAAGAVAAAVGVAEVLRKTELEGRIEVIGTPAEECTFGEPGKVPLVLSGVFDGLAACLMFHPWDETMAIVNDLGVIVLDLTFEGRTAHAAADPWNGKNALDGVVGAYNLMSLLRQQMKPDGRIHIIVTDGGQAVNIIPERASARVMIRSMDISYLEELLDRVTQCAEAAALGTGTKLEIKTVMKSLNTRMWDHLYEVVSRNFLSYGIELRKPVQLFGSSDFGMVTHRVPAFAFAMQTHPRGTRWHSTAVRDGSVEKPALDGMILAAKVLAASAIDVLVMDIVEIKP
jgi:amidohydrolase